MSLPLIDKYDRHAMLMALRLAESVKGSTGDNPAVGAVIYKKAKILGRGRTQPPGRDHAEKQALKQAGKSAQGASLAVTLEPCCHVGRTPPCTTDILKAGIRRILVPVKDPNPKVNGKGFKQLQRAGVRVITGLFSREAALLNRDFFKFIRTGKPYVILKAGLTLNGMIAADSGNSKWITSEASRKQVHLLRAKTDAVLIGLKTAVKDNPSLDVRLVKGRNPIRVVLSHGADLPRSLNLVKTADKIRTLLLTPKQSVRPAAPFVEYVSLNSASCRPRIRGVLKTLGRLGIKSLLVEGGNSLFTQFVEQKCADEYYLFLAPRLLSNGIPFLKGRRSASIREGFPLRDWSFKKTGPDLLIKAKAVA